MRYTGPDVCGCHNFIHNHADGVDARDELLECHTSQIFTRGSTTLYMDLSESEIFENFHKGCGGVVMLGVERNTRVGQNNDDKAG